MVPGPASTELGQSYDSDEIVAGVGAEPTGAASWNPSSPENIIIAASMIVLRKLLMLS